VSAAEPITYIRTEDLLGESFPSERARVPGLGRRRHVAGVVVAVVGLALLTLLLTEVRDTFSLESQVLLYLLAVVIVAVIGGMAVALGSAIAAAFLINYYFVRPVHTLQVAQGEQALALLVFLIVAAIVSGAVELANRRGRVAEHAALQAETLSALAGGELDESESLHGILDRARNTFQMESVALKVREGGEWRVVDEVGWAPPGEEASLRFDVPMGQRLRLVGRGTPLFAQDQRVLQAFAAAAQTAYEGLRLSERAQQASELATADHQRTALLAAVGHDLRTPLAGIKASVSTLRQTDVEWSVEERAELLATIEESADRLDSIVANLLDASRLQAGALSVQAKPVALDEVIGSAVLAVPGAAERVTLDVPDDLPLVQADPGLLERVLANLLENAIRYGARDRPVEVSAAAGGDTATLKVVDHGPGVPEDRREGMFQAFQHADDRGTSRGVGLGLSVARGFMEAMGGVLIADSSSGTGLTMRLRLPLAK
jgi:two-component system sensor histidine kinase KdpD